VNNNVPNPPFLACLSGFGAIMVQLVCMHKNKPGEAIVGHSCLFDCKLAGLVSVVVDLFS